MMQCRTWTLDGDPEGMIDMTTTEEGRLLLDGVPVQTILHWADGLTTLVTITGITQVMTAEYLKIITRALCDKGGDQTSGRADRLRERSRERS